MSATSEIALGAKSPVSLGQASPALLRAATRLLERGHPCAGLVLSRLDPHWALERRNLSFTLEGMPSTATLAMDSKLDGTPASKATLREILAPYGGGEPYFVEVHIQTVDGGDKAITTVTSRLAGADGFFASGQLAEQPVRIVWSKQDRRLLSLSEAP